MKKIILFLITVFLAYLTAYQTTGKKNGHPSPFDFSWIDSIDFQSSEPLSIPEDYPEFTRLNENMLEGYEYFVAENYYEAIAEFENELNTPEAKTKANLMIGRSYHALSEVYMAESYYDAAIYSDEKDAETYFWRGKLKYEQSNYEDAVSDLYLSTELGYPKPEAKYYLSLAYEYQNNIDAALLSALESIETDSLFTDGMFQAGRMYYASEKYRQTADMFRKYLQYKTDDKYAMLNLALAYNKMKILDSALILYNQIIIQNPDYTLAYNNRGWMYYETEEYKAALEDYNAALKIDPNYELSLWNRANLFFETGNFEQALIDYEKLFEISADNSNALFHAARCRDNMNQPDEAAALYLKFIAQDKGNLAYTEKAKEFLKNLE